MLRLLAKSSRNGSVERLDISKPLTVTAQAGDTFTLVDDSLGMVPEDVRLKRVADDLVIEHKDGSVTIQDFYLEHDQLVMFSLDGSLSPSAENAVLGGGASGQHDGQGVIWEAGEFATASSAPFSGGILAGIGSLAVAGIAGPTSATPPPIVNTVAGTVVAGPVIETHGLAVVLYEADGVTELARTRLDAKGQFSVKVGSYTGVVIVKAEDTDAGADYLDEATGVAKDLNAALFSADVIAAPNSTLTVNLNALTTIAYQKAVEDAGDKPLDEDVVNVTNSAIAKLFGLTDLQGTAIVTVNGETTFDTADGVSEGETYGAILAVLSGIDANNQGDSQKTIDELIAGINLAAGQATLSVQAQDNLSTGVLIAEPVTRLDLNAVTIDLDTTKPDVSMVAISNSSGLQNSLLNTGDTVDVSVTMTEIVVVDTSNGTPLLELTNGSETVNAVYSSGSGTNTLIFKYTILTNQADTDGISVPENALSLNGASILDGYGNSAILSHSAVAANANYLVDTSAPTANFTAATDDVGSVTGALSSGDTTDDTALVLSGSCVAGSTVNVYNGITLLGAATVTGTSWSYTATVADGTTYQFNVTETDAAGNTSSATNDFTVVGDTHQPPPTTVTCVYYTTDADKLTIIGTNFDTIVADGRADGEDVSGQLDWSKLVWYVKHSDPSNPTIAIPIKATDVVSAVAINDTTLEVVFKNNGTDRVPDFAAPVAENFDALENDFVRISAGFTQSVAGAKSTTDEFASIPFTGDSSVVVFDLVDGVSSSHSERSFDPNVSYTIYIRVDSDSVELNTGAEGSTPPGCWHEWSGGENLSQDDLVVLVGSSSSILGRSSLPVTRFFGTRSGWMSWMTDKSYAFGLNRGGSVSRLYAGSFASGLNLWTGSWGSNPNLHSTSQLVPSSMLLLTMPNGVMTSQGLAYTPTIE